MTYKNYDLTTQQNKAVAKFSTRNSFAVIGYKYYDVNSNAPFLGIYDVDGITIS